MKIEWRESYGTYSAQLGIMRLETNYTKDGYEVRIVGDRVLNYKQKFQSSDQAKTYLIKAALLQVDKMRQALADTIVA